MHPKLAKRIALIYIDKLSALGFKEASDYVENMIGHLPDKEFHKGEIRGQVQLILDEAAKSGGPPPDRSA